MPKPDRMMHGAREMLESRFASLEAASGVSFAGPVAKSKFDNRVQMLKRSILLEDPGERTPVLPNVELFPAWCNGRSDREIMYDSEAAVGAWMKYLNYYDPDFYFGPEAASSGQMVDALNLKFYRWPGRGGASDDSTLQYVESDWMKADEYEDLIEDPTGFWLKKYLPRICGALSGLADMSSATQLVELPMFLGNIAQWGRPEVMDALHNLMEAGKAARSRMERMQQFDLDAKALGYVAGRGGMCKVPFDVIGDTLRGTIGIARDLFARPEAIREATARLAPVMVKMGVETANRTGHPVVFIPMHKGDDDFMSDEQFRDLYWPSCIHVVRGLVENGCVPFLFIEGKFNRRLEYLQELPPKSTICLLDRTDLGMAREKLENIACIAGGVPTQVLMFKTPEEVKQHCRMVIDKYAGSGFILANGAIFDHCPPDNLKAMIDSSRQ